jgi:hypothetical protein
MKVAVLSLTRDRLSFTKHCFATLRENAGCEFDHYVLDQGSRDGTQDWLRDEYYEGRVKIFHPKTENLGVSKGINRLLDLYVMSGKYDVIVKVDNDLELLVPGTLKAACEVALEGWISSPHIQGLNSPPAVEREEEVAGYRIGVPNIMGGIFMASPASLYETYRHDEANPIWGLDDAKIVDHWRAYGGEVGYLLDYPANHYLTTPGQEAAEPVYFERKRREFV